MEIYIEYAFIENFALDALLCYLAFKFLRLPIKSGFIILSGVIGAIFAVAYPFLSLFRSAKILGDIFKATFPFLASFFGFGCKIRKKDVDRYETSVISYYCLSFVFAGGVYAFCSVFDINYALGEGVFVGVPIATVSAVSVFLVLGVRKLVKTLYRRVSISRFVYPCKLVFGGRQVRAEGYLDSGNLAQKSGIPVCFLSAELFFEVFGARAFEDGEEELRVSTVSGEKRVKLFILDELLIYSERGENIVYKPYCAVSPALQGKEYQILLGAWAVDGMKE